MFLQPGPNGEPPLNVPRMLPGFYELVKHMVQQKLECFYERTEIPKDAPQKSSFGDVDVIVDGPLHDITPEVIAEALDAVRYVANGRTVSYAMKWPDQDPDEDPKYIQVDVEEVDCPDWEWSLFVKAYGDMRQIIAVLHRRLGLSFTDKGLFARIEEMEAVNRKKSLVFLSNDPDDVLQFLGLDPGPYHRGFALEEDLFEWIVTCRFFNRENATAKTEKANDRRRLMQRHMYRCFFQEWLPMVPIVMSESNSYTRKQVLHMSLQHFDAHDAYQQRLVAHLITMRELNFWKLVKTRIPGGKHSSRQAIRALKSWIDIQDGVLLLRSVPLDVDADQPTWAAAVCRKHHLFTPDHQPKESNKELQAVLEFLHITWESAVALEKRRTTLQSEV